jgi:hypothetical protein
VVAYSTKGVNVNYGKDYDGTEDEPDYREGREEWRDMQADALYDQAQEKAQEDWKTMTNDQRESYVVMVSLCRSLGWDIETDNDGNHVIYPGIRDPYYSKGENNE